MTAKFALLRVHWPRAKTWSLRLAEYGLVQIGVQALTALSGFLLVRGLSKPEYAMFAIVNSMQSTANLLADVGIGIGVRSIGGRVWNDPERFGQLLNTTINLRRQFAFFSLLITLPITGWMLLRNGASIGMTLSLCLIMVVSITPLLGATAWGLSAVLHGEYRRMQKMDFGNALMRCTLIGALCLTQLNVILASLVGAIGNWVASLFYKRWAQDKIILTAGQNQADRKEMISLSLKSLPNAVFFCFQGQITFLILTLVGNTNGIADVMALGRIAVLFTVFSVTFNNILSPRFGRCQDPAQLPRLYWSLVGGSAGIFLLLSASVWLFPGPFLWLLGPKYSSLGPELAWITGAACISQIAGVMWGLNSSKAWIRFQAPGFIPSIIAVQIIAALLLDLRTFHDILLFNLVSAVAPIPVYALDAIAGLRAKPEDDQTVLLNQG